MDRRTLSRKLAGLLPADTSQQWPTYRLYDVLAHLQMIESGKSHHADDLLAQQARIAKA